MRENRRNAVPREGYRRGHYERQNRLNKDDLPHYRADSVYSFYQQHHQESTKQTLQHCDGDWTRGLVIFPSICRACCSVSVKATNVLILYFYTGNSIKMTFILPSTSRLWSPVAGSPLFSPIHGALPYMELSPIHGAPPYTELCPIHGALPYMEQHKRNIYIAGRLEVLKASHEAHTNKMKICIVTWSQHSLAQDLLFQTTYHILAIYS